MLFDRTLLPLQIVFDEMIWRVHCIPHQACFVQIRPDEVVCTLVLVALICVIPTLYMEVVHNVVMEVPVASALGTSGTRQRVLGASPGL